MADPTRVERYRRALPAHEFAALEAWLSTYYPFQLDWLLEPSDYAICNKSRQIGLSHTTSGLGVLWGAFHGELTTIISIGELESGEVLDKAKRHAKVLASLGSKMAQPVRDNAKELAFASGGRILALPSTGGRSFTGNVFLDEFAYQEHAAKVWDAAAAVTMLGGRLRVASTPNGVGNDYHGLWKKAADPASGWVRHEIPLQRAIEQGYPVDIKKCWSLAKGDVRLFDQLFNCKFLDGEAQYIPTPAVTACSVADLYCYEGECFGGLDIGRVADLTVLTILKRDAFGICWLARLESCKRTDWDALEAMVDRAFRDFKLKRLCVDSTGIGAFPAERMQKKHGKLRVEPVDFTLQSKEDLATTLFSAFTEETIRIPLTDAALPGVAAGEAQKLRDDLCAIRRIITSAGNIRYDAPHTDEGHADRAWSLGLALHACGKAPGRMHQIAPGANFNPTPVQ